MLREPDLDRRCYAVTVQAQLTFRQAYFKTYHDLTRKEALDEVNNWKDNVLCTRIVVSANKVEDYKLVHHEQEFNFDRDPVLQASVLKDASIDRRGWHAITIGTNEEIRKTYFNKKRAEKLLGLWLTYDANLDREEVLAMLRAVFPLADIDTLKNYVEKNFYPWWSSKKTQPSE